MIVDSNSYSTYSVLTFISSDLNVFYVYFKNMVVLEINRRKMELQDNLYMGNNFEIHSHFLKIRGIIHEHFEVPLYFSTKKCFLVCHPIAFFFYLVAFIVSLYQYLSCQFSKFCPVVLMAF